MKKCMKLPQRKVGAHEEGSVQHGEQQVDFVNEESPENGNPLDSIYEIFAELCHHEQNTWTSLDDVLQVTELKAIPEETVGACIGAWVEFGIIGISSDGRQLRFIVKPATGH